jgi:hypothetical protein
MDAMSLRRFALLGAALTGVVACGDPPPGDTYFDHFIQPVLVQNCANNVSGCHRTEDGDPFLRAAGNLDVTTFERISKRRDLLAPFGAYATQPLLIKASAPTLVAALDPLNGQTLNYNGTMLPLEIAHSGQGIIDVNSDSFVIVLDWLANGATENGLKPPTPAQAGDGACSTAIPSQFDAAAEAAARAEPGFAPFDQDVEPIFKAKNCAAGNCHGAPQADFYITCGDTPTQVAFNYLQSRGFVGTPPDQSQILNVPLARAGGGLGHTGGDQFSGRTDPDYIKVRDWAAIAGPFPFGVGNPPQAFFADHVQPVLLQRGCSFMNCHSPAATNDFKLRSGSLGFFSPLSLQKNYDLLKHEFMALEYPDARSSRVVSKNVLPEAGGIRHRGGPVLETPGRNVGTPAGACPPFDPANPEVSFSAGVPPGETQFSPFCTIQAWLELERFTLGAQVDPLDPGDTVDIIYVERPAPGRGPGDTLLEFDTYRPNSNLMRASSTLGPTRNLTAAVGNTSILGGCAGTNPTTADVRSPDVNRDGNRVAFAMRRDGTEGLQIWTVNKDGTNCQMVTTPAAPVGGITIHNFDPVWSPDGNYIVFASTRGSNGMPSRSRSAGFLPQSDIWRMDASGGALEQVTFLSNSEIGPAFMREGRITMTTEKVFVDPDAKQGANVFRQLAGRRINWDRTDYHPLLAQRAQSPFADPNDLAAMGPTVDYAQATDIRERANGDFLVIFSDDGAKGGGGALGIFNRSAGTFERGRRTGGDEGFLESVLVADGFNEGRLASTSAYRSPFGLPDGEIMASFATVGSLQSANNIDWDIVSVAVDPTSGNATRTVIIGGGDAAMDAVLAIKKPPGVFFVNKRQLVFGGQFNPGHPATAHVHFPDVPMVFTLLTGNLRHGRPIAAFREATRLEVFTEGKNPGTTATEMGIYQSRSLVGGVDLEEDGSTRIEVPSGQGVVLKLVNENGVVVSMGEEHQFGPGEEISLGIRESLFDAACGGCHGSVSGSELDIATKPDVLTGASASLAQGLLLQLTP